MIKLIIDIHPFLWYNINTERGDVNFMDWFKYGNNFTTNTTTNAYCNVSGLFGDKVETHCTGVEFDDVMDNVVADVEYVELESTPCICNKCKHVCIATKIDIFNYNSGVKELLCNYNDYKKPINGGKTECRHFELREDV